MTKIHGPKRGAGPLAGSAAIALLLVFGASPVIALQDPTRPPDFHSAPAQAAPQKALTVGSILIGEQRRTAVINGELRSEGQRFDGVRVQRIYPDRVQVLDQGQVRILRLEALPQVRGTQ
ncbi:MAG: hypothetical protein ACQEV6_15080 [Pseudomonadota bacterium]